MQSVYLVKENLVPVIVMFDLFGHI